MLDSTGAGFAQDLRYAACLIRRQPRFALLVTLTMAVGSGDDAPGSA
jgi:hypothetical protein